MKQEFTYAEYNSDAITGIDRQFLLQEMVKIPNKNTAIHVNTFGVEYHKIPIKDAIKLIFRDEDKIYICFKQLATIKRGPKFKGDSAGFVKDNAELIFNK